MAIHFDGWQRGASQLALGKRKDGKYAATIGGVTWSIPRQVGKTFSVGSLVMAMCAEFAGLRVIWTAHRTRTSTNTFRSMQSLAKRKKVAPHIAPNGIRTANGEQEIRFANGSLILFGAREQGFGRGFDEIDLLVFDEAQILTEKALEDMVASTNQARHEAGALIFFIGTPPRPIDPGEAFSMKRTKALSGKSDDLVYVEFSADEDADPDDREQWEQANPSFPHRTPLESMLRLRENLPSDEAWKREALGIWDAKSTSSVIDAVSWGGVADEASMAIADLSLAIDVAPDRSTASVALAGRRADGLWHIELDEQRNGTGWIVPFVTQRCERNAIRAVVVDEKSPAASLVDEFRQAGVKVTTTGAMDMASACAGLYDLVMREELRHTDQPQVNASLASASKRPLLDGAWAWNRKGDASDITSIVAVTLALWGSRNSKVNTPTRKRSTRARRAVVM